MKDKRYKRMKRAILAGASSGIVAGMIFMASTSTAFADTVDANVPSFIQNTSDSGVHMMRRWKSGKGVKSIAKSLGLSREKIKEELRSGKTMKQIMQENGIDPAEVSRGLKK